MNKSKNEANLQALFVKLDPIGYPLGESTLTVDVVNTKSGTAYYAIVRAESPVADIERNEVFVGTLNPDDFESVDFIMKFRNVTAEVYPVNITVSYKDKDDMPITEYDTVYVKLISAEEAMAMNKITTPPWIYAVYLITVIVILRYIIWPIVKRIVRHFRHRSPAVHHVRR